MNSNSLPPVKERLYCLDWIRVMSFGLLLFYHVALMFVDWDSMIKNDELSNGLKLPMLFIRQWRMPLLFFISGVGTWYALKKINGRMFLKERFTRLFIPLAFGFLFIIPNQNYAVALYNDKPDLSYFSFLNDHFFHHFRWNHLWFIAYLLVFSVLALPFFLFLRGETGTLWSKRLTGFFLKNRFSLLFLVLPLFVVEYLLRDAWPDKRKLIQDWYNFSFYLITFIYGYFIASSDSIWNRIEADRLFYFLVGCACFIFIYLELQNTGADLPEQANAHGAVFKFIKCLTTISWMLCFTGYAKKYLNIPSRPLQHLNKAVYPFYILHQPVFLAIGCFVLPMSSGILTKYVLITAGTLVAIGILYEGIIRKWKWAALVFGVKKDERISGAFNIGALESSLNFLRNNWTKTNR